MLEFGINECLEIKRERNHFHMKCCHWTFDPCCGHVIVPTQVHNNLCTHHTWMAAETPCWSPYTYTHKTLSAQSLAHIPSGLFTDSFYLGHQFQAEPCNARPEVRAFFPLLPDKLLSNYETLLTNSGIIHSGDWRGLLLFSVMKALRAVV